jgi:acetoin utilization deacetylase AcuC-like enzyme
MQVSVEAMVERDALVFQLCRECGTPVCMLLSGGYAKDSASAVAQSLGMLLRNEASRPGQTTGCHD